MAVRTGGARRLAYPLIDCAIATVLVGAAVRLPREHAAPISLALAGILALLVTNLVTFNLGRVGQLSSPEPAEAGYLLAFGLMGLGALLRSGTRTPAARRPAWSSSCCPTSVCRRWCWPC